MQVWDFWTTNKSDFERDGLSTILYDFTVYEDPWDISIALSYIDALIFIGLLAQGGCPTPVEDYLASIDLSVEAQDNITISGKTIELNTTMNDEITIVVQWNNNGVYLGEKLLTADTREVI